MNDKVIAITGASSGIVRERVLEYYGSLGENG